MFLARLEATSKVVTSKQKVRNGQRGSDADDDGAASSTGRQRCRLLRVQDHPSTSSFEPKAVETEARFCSLQAHRVPRVPEAHTHGVYCRPAWVRDTIRDVL